MIAIASSSFYKYINILVRGHLFLLVIMSRPDHAISIFSQFLILPKSTMKVDLS